MSVSAPLMSSSARKNVLIVYIVHETTPIEPARAVNTAMRILRSFPKLNCFDMFSCLEFSV